jgi:beta-carotene 3-hydroxylase
MVLLGILVFTSTFFVMEFVAWAAHKYLMHGIMWRFHQDHHQNGPGFFEKNDVFFLIFAIPAWLCIMLGMMYQNWPVVFVGAGISFYGICYFFIHDVFIHRRFKFLRNTRHPYFMAIRKAHKVHHKYLDRHHGECFGMLLVPPKFYREAKKSMRISIDKGNDATSSVQVKQ